MLCCNMDFFYVGTIALNYWMQKYYKRDFKKNTDVDISSDALTLEELKSKYPHVDTVPLLSGNNFNIFKFKSHHKYTNKCTKC